MPRKVSQRGSVAIQAPKGSKKTFDDDEELEDVQPVASSSKTSTRQARYDSEDDEDDDDDDDAPEAMGVGASRAVVDAEIEKAERALQAKKEAARARSQKIAAMKAAKQAPSLPQATANKKGKRPVSPDDSGSEDDDEETRRLKARMAKAMDAGEGDSEESDGESFHTDSEGEELEEEGDEEEVSDNEMGESFHTDSDEEEDLGNEDDEEEEEEEGNSDDDSETLEDGPIDEATRKLRERMQAAMEAAEQRAGIAPSKPKSAVKPDSGPSKSASKPSSKRKADQEISDDDNQWNLSVGVGGPQPLSAEVLRAAETAELENQKKKAAKLAQSVAGKQEQQRRKKKKTNKGKTEISLKLGERKSVQVLQPTLDLASGGMPPVFEAAKRITGQAPGRDSKKRFMKTAMKFSGIIPGKEKTAGRRSAKGLEAGR